MAYLFPLLLVSGLTGGLILLGLSSISELRGVRNPTTAAWLLFQSLLWFVVPSTARWILSTWSPGSVLSGWLIVDIQPEIWWLGFILPLILSARMWSESAEKRESMPLTGVLVLFFLVTTWLSLTSGSIAMTLIAWGINDVIWCVASLLSGGDGERVVIGTAVLGVSSLLLWAVSLFLLQNGISSLWWLIQPTESILTLLIIAAVIRIGFYPFHIVLNNGASEGHTLGAVYSMAPMAGIGLLFRVVKIPGVEISSWLAVWALISAAWCAVRANTGKNRNALLWVSYAVLHIIIATTVLSENTEMLATGLAIWLGCYALLMMPQGSRPIPWSWPAWIAAFYLLAFPPSMLLSGFDAIILNTPLSVQVLTLFTFVLLFQAIFTALRSHFGSVRIPWSTHVISYVLSFILPIIVIGWTSIRFGFESPSWLVFFLWLGAMIVSAILFIYGRVLQRIWVRFLPILDIFDGQWFYHAVWQGSVNLLNFVRVLSNVVEGRGSLLWSLLILLLVILIVSSR